MLENNCLRNLYKILLKHARILKIDLRKTFLSLRGNFIFHEIIQHFESKGHLCKVNFLCYGIILHNLPSCFKN